MTFQNLSWSVIGFFANGISISQDLFKLPIIRSLIGIHFDAEYVLCVNVPPARVGCALSAHGLFDASVLLVLRFQFENVFCRSLISMVDSFS